jgi:hypothetical protein
VVLLVMVASKEYCKQREKDNIEMAVKENIIVT